MLPGLANIRIVLVETSHPGNIGSTARAMKTMGLGGLRLVSPYRFPSAEATAMASGADDLLQQAGRYERLTDALADCSLVYGATARVRSIPWPMSDVREAVQDALPAAADGSTVAFVFGREDRGLDNEELALCQRMIRIPTNPDFGSLNLAQAVQVVSYELRMAALGNQTLPPLKSRDFRPETTGEELEQLFTHLEQSLTAIGFYDPTEPRKLMPRLRRLFQRAGLDRHEYNILRGILRAVDAAALRRGS